MPSKYRSLRPDRIIETQRRLQQRIARRFVGSGLSEVGAELQIVAEEAAARAERIRRPNVLLRIAVAALLLGAATFVVVIATSLRIKADLREVLNLVQFLEAGLGTVVFLGVAVLFLLSLELRLKRRRALAALHELRAIAHVIDMHQVAKDPEGLIRREATGPRSANQTTKTLYDLNRYLNYCNELLAIVSKVAALYVQDFPDSHTVSAVDHIETLCAGLSGKIWQKIMVLEHNLDDPTSSTDEPGREGPAAHPSAAPEASPGPGRPGGLLPPGDPAA